MLCFVEGGGRGSDVGGSSRTSIPPRVCRICVFLSTARLVPHSLSGANVWPSALLHDLISFSLSCADPVHTHPAVSTVPPPPGHDNDLDCERSPHQLTAEPVMRDRQRSDKGRWDGSTLLPSTTQPTASQLSTAHLAALHGAERSRVMDAVDGAEGVQEIRASDLVGRRWDLRLGDLDVEDAFRLGLDLADYSERSASTAPPPYTQIA